MSGRPMDRRRRKVRIPIGIEKVLCAAAGDREFREQLLMARADALAGTGLEISDAEAMILKSVSEDALRTMIDSIDLRRHQKRSFFRGIAAASLAGATAVCAAGCDTYAGVMVDHIDVDDNYGEMGITDSSGRSDEFEPPPDVVYAEDAVDAGNWGDTPADEVAPPDVAEISAGVDVKDPEDVQEVDVEDVQVYAGIPPMDITEE